MDGDDHTAFDASWGHALALGLTPTWHAATVHTGRSTLDDELASTMLVSAVLLVA